MSYVCWNCSDTESKTFYVSPCGHVICESCADEVISKSSDESNKFLVSCSTCSMPHFIGFRFLNTSRYLEKHLPKLQFLDNKWVVRCPKNNKFCYNPISVADIGQFIPNHTGDDPLCCPAKFIHWAVPTKYISEVRNVKFKFKLNIFTKYICFSKNLFYFLLQGNKTTNVDDVVVTFKNYISYTWTKGKE